MSLDVTITKQRDLNQVLPDISSIPSHEKRDVQRQKPEQKYCHQIPKLTYENKDVKREYSHTEKLEYIQRQSREVVQALRSASKSKLIRGLADRIELCTHSKNLFTASDLHNAETGEAFDGKGALWSCNSRICSSCQSRLGKRNRKTVRALLENEKLLLGEHWFFITFTMPDLSLKGLDLLTHRAVMYTAHRKFYRSEFWKKLSRGSIKSEEFTLGKNEETNFHYHIHLLAICRSKIQHDNFIGIRSAWTDALEFAFKKHGIELEINTKDGYANVNVEKVRDREKVVFEITKYLTKNESWLQLDRATLLQVAEIKRFPRMFETFGFVSDKRHYVRDAKESTDKQGGETYFNKNDVKVRFAESDQPKKMLWREACQTLSRAEWKDFLNKQFVVCSRHRKKQLKATFPQAKFQTLLGVTF